MKSNGNAALWLFLFSLVFLCSHEGHARSCLSGNCHATLSGARFPHGPVAAEAVVGGNCRVCHEQAGPGCTKSTGGEFRLKSARLCQSCHGQEYATKHTAVASDCLSCHDPHCSDSSPFRLRAAVGLKGVDAPSSTAVERSL